MITETDYNAIRNDTAEIADEYNVNGDILERIQAETLEQIKKAARAQKQYQEAVDLILENQVIMYSLNANEDALIMQLVAE